MRLPAAAPIGLLVPAAPFLAAAAVGGSNPATTPTGPRPPTVDRAVRSGPNEIDYVDVAQGDGVVMRIGGQFIVSDAGQRNPEAIDATLHKLGATNTIDVAILSHPHSDHVKNFMTLLTQFGWQIRTAVLSHSDWWKGTKTNADLIKALESHGADLVFVSAGQHFSWGGADWEILSPPPDKYTMAGQAPNASVVYVLTIKKTKLLFTGDIGASVANDVARRWESEGLGQASVFLVTHHGSAAGSTEPLLAAIKPTWAVLSTGPNSYGHPAEAAITAWREPAPRSGARTPTARSAPASPRRAGSPGTPPSNLLPGGRRRPRAKRGVALAAEATHRESEAVRP